MFLLSKPSREDIGRFIAGQDGQPFSYTVADGLEAPRGYIADHNRMELGKGEAVWERGVEAIKRWEMFNIGWLELCWPDTLIQKGAAVAVLARHFGFWSLNGCRIVRVIEEEGDARRYGFAYGTLGEHVERGEEQFLIEWRREDNSVWYDLRAYSTPNHFLAKLGYPVTRALQRRFARDSMNAMLRAVGRERGGLPALQPVL